jgi:hypothetical protein
MKLFQREGRKWCLLDYVFVIVFVLFASWMFFGIARDLYYSGDCEKVCQPDTDSRVVNIHLFWQPCKCSCSSPRVIELP